MWGIEPRLKEISQRLGTIEGILFQMSNTQQTASAELAAIESLDQSMSQVLTTVATFVSQQNAQLAQLQQQIQSAPGGTVNAADLAPVVAAMQANLQQAQAILPTPPAATSTTTPPAADGASASTPAASDNMAASSAPATPDATPPAPI